MNYAFLYVVAVAVLVYVVHKAWRDATEADRRETVLDQLNRDIAP